MLRIVIQSMHLLHTHTVDDITGLTSNIFETTTLTENSTFDVKNKVGIIIEYDINIGTPSHVTLEHTYTSGTNAKSVGILPSTSTTKANTTTGNNYSVTLHYNGTGSFNSDHGINIILLSKTSSWSDTGAATILSTFGNQSSTSQVMWPTVTTFAWFNSYSPVIKCRSGSCKLIYSLTTIS